MLKNGRNINLTDLELTNINSNYSKIYGQDVSESGDDLHKEYRYKWHNNPKNNVVENFPLFLDIEITSACNLKCKYCVQTKSNFKKGYMSFDLFKKIIDEASEEGCYGIKFHAIGRGEPLLHRNIVDMIAYAVKKGLIDVYLNTNALLLTKKVSEEILSTNLNRISFSLDGYNKKSYEFNRTGSRWNIIRANIKNFYNLREKNKSNTLIRIQSVDLKNINKKQYIKVWKDFCDEIGFIKYKEMNRRKFGIESDWQCPQLWQRMAILYDGTLIPCNHDDRQYAVLGNINNTSIKKVWNSSAMHYIRELHLQGKANFLSACDGCYLRTSEIGN